MLAWPELSQLLRREGKGDEAHLSGKQFASKSFPWSQDWPARRRSEMRVEPSGERGGPRRRGDSCGPGLRAAFGQPLGSRGRARWTDQKPQLSPAAWEWGLRGAGPDAASVWACFLVLSAITFQTPHSLPRGYAAWKTQRKAGQQPKPEGHLPGQHAGQLSPNQPPPQAQSR